MKTKNLSGVSWHVGRQAWRVGFRHDKKDIYMGCHRDEQLAGWIADFARYMILGLNPAKWHTRVGRPNNKPHMRDDYPRVLVLARLAQIGVISEEKLQQRIAEFDAACEKTPL